MERQQVCRSTLSECVIVSNFRTPDAKLPFAFSKMVVGQAWRQGDSTNHLFHPPEGIRGTVNHISYMEGNLLWV